MVAISIDEALNELSSSVDRLAVTIQPFQAFLAYSQGETFLQKLLAESEEETNRIPSLVGGLKPGAHVIASKPAFQQTLPPVCSFMCTVLILLYAYSPRSPLYVLFSADSFFILMLIYIPFSIPLWYG